MASSGTKFDYDEIYYPRAADSDMESEISSERSVETNASEEHTSVNMEDGLEEGLGVGDGVGGEGEGIDVGLGVPLDMHAHTHAHHTHSGAFGHQESTGGMEDYVCVICAQMLVDPLTLHCGHSFCQLCLARMWVNKNQASPLNLQCPVCRQLWRNLPQINIQLRNIIDHRHSELVETRRSTLSEADHKVLQLFSSMRESERVRAPDRPVPPEVRRVVQRLLILFGLVIVVLIVGFCLLLWVWVGAGGEFMRKPVAKWNSEDVAEWVEGLGEWAKHNYSQIFRRERITGPRLLILDDKALQTIGIKPEYRRQTILRGIEEVKLMEFSTPRNFHEFKAAHRKQTLLIVAFYKSWPRLTFVYAYIFSYYDIFLPLIQFHFPLPLPLSLQDDGGEPLESHYQETWEERKEELGLQGDQDDSDVGKKEAATMEEVDDEPSWRQLFAFAIEVVLIPHLLVAWYAWSWFDLHPWICSAVIIHCAWITWREWRAIIEAVKGGNWLNVTWRDVWAVNWTAKIPDLIRSIVKRSISYSFNFAFFFIIATVLWHVTPHFVCDILFYLILWHTLYMHLLLNYTLMYFRVRQERQEQRQLEIGIRIAHRGGL